MGFGWLRKRREAAAQREEAQQALRAAEHQAFLDALKAVVDISVAQSRANESLSDALRTWLEMFKVEGKPTRWANDDLSESIQAANRLRELHEQGFPTQMPPEDQAAWVAVMADRTF